LFAGRELALSFELDLQLDFCQLGIEILIIEEEQAIYFMFGEFVPCQYRRNSSRSLPWKTNAAIDAPPSCAQRPTLGQGSFFSR
jgi:hypothetical protein